MSSSDPVLNAVEQGNPAIVVCGNFHDLTMIGSDIAYRPSYLASKLAEDFVVIRFSRSRGMTITNLSELPEGERKDFQSRLREAGLDRMLRHDQQGTSEEVVQFFRSVRRLMLKPADQGRPVALIIDYGENLAPAVQTAAAAAPDHIFVAESIHEMAMGPALSKTGNVLICVVRDGLQHQLLSDLPRDEYGFPDKEEATSFIRIATSKKSADGRNYYAALEDSLGVDELGRLLQGLPLRSIHKMFLAGKTGDGVITRAEALDGKADAIIAASEGTLGAKTTTMDWNDIVGQKAAMNQLAKIADLFKEGSLATSRAIALVGPPGTAKSTIPPLLAQRAGANSVELTNVQNMYVGESQRRMRAAQRLIEALQPVVVFQDELTETLPSRSQRGGDSPVSQELLGMQLQFFARDDLRGKVLFVGATNVPDRLDVAWHDRFLFIPLLELGPDEMQQLLVQMAQRIHASLTIEQEAPEIVEACLLLHRKGASPRKFYDLLNHAFMMSGSGTLSPKDILAAANSFTGTGNPHAVAFTSLSAIALTTYKEYLPWSLDPQNYAYPWYLEGIVDKLSGEVDRIELEKRRNEYRKLANL